MTAEPCEKCQECGPCHAECIAKEETMIGTPVVTLGFTREELDGMDVLAFPGSKEEWIHEMVKRGITLGAEFDFPVDRDAARGEDE